MVYEFYYWLIFDRVNTFMTIIKNSLIYTRPANRSYSPIYKTKAIFWGCIFFWLYSCRKTGLCQDWSKSCTLRSLIDGGCGIVGWLEKISKKLIVGGQRGGVGMVWGLEKTENLKGQGGGLAFKLLFSFLF